MAQKVRLDNYGVRALFRSIRLETFSGKAIEHIDHCHPNLFMYKLLCRSDNEHKICFVRDQSEIYRQL